MSLLPLASGPFFSLNNTDFVVMVGFLLFVAILIYFKVPELVTGMLDDRAAKIRADLDEARALREEAQSLLASFERKQKEVAEQAEGIVRAAKADAEAAADQAKEALELSMARRLRAASEQIDAAEAAAVKEVKDRAVTVAVAAAESVITEKMTAANASALVDDAIKTVGARLN